MISKASHWSFNFLFSPSTGVLHSDLLNNYPIRYRRRRVREWIFSSSSMSYFAPRRPYGGKGQHLRCLLLCSFYPNLIRLLNITFIKVKLPSPCQKHHSTSAEPSPPPTSTPREWRRLRIASWSSGECIFLAIRKRLTPAYFRSANFPVGSAPISNNTFTIFSLANWMARCKGVPYFVEIVLESRPLASRNLVINFP